MDVEDEKFLEKLTGNVTSDLNASFLGNCVFSTKSEKIYAFGYSDLIEAPFYLEPATPVEIKNDEVDGIVKEVFGELGIQYQPIRVGADYVMVHQETGIRGRLGVLRTDRCVK